MADSWARVGSGDIKVNKSLYSTALHYTAHTDHRTVPRYSAQLIHLFGSLMKQSTNDSIVP